MQFTIPTRRIGLTVAALVAGASLVAGCDPGAPSPPSSTATAQGSGTNGDGQPDIAPADGMTGAVTPAARPDLPKYWYKTEEQFDEWIGLSWTEVDLLRFLPQAPRGIDQGTRYVVFYGPTCEHCEEMFKQDLAPDPTFAAQVTAVLVPTSDPPTWTLPRTDCELLALPEGPDWIITTPLTLRIENGVVRCVTEGDHKECMGLETP